MCTDIATDFGVAERSPRVAVTCQNVEKPSTLSVIPCPVASYMNVVPWLVG